MGIKALSFLAVLLLNTTGGAAGVVSPHLPAALPDGLPDGHYMGDGSIDPKTGLLQYTYLGPIDYDAVDKYVAASADPSANLFRRLTVNCYGRTAGDSVDGAQAAFASYWGGKQLNNYWVRTTQGGTMAYMCNYDGQMVTIVPSYLSQMGSVDSVCGKGRAGWYDNGNGRYTYGRDHINAQLCP